MAVDVTAQRTHLARGLLACVIVVGSLALWTAVPVGWMYFTSGLVTHEGARFVLVIFGVPATMALVFMALGRVDSYRRNLDPAPSDASGNQRSRGHSLLEVMLVVSGAIALIALVAWWFLLADSPDPSGPLQPI